MPIVGLTTTGNINRALPLFGKLFKGDKKGEKTPGKDLQYFRIELAPEFSYLQDKVIEVFGEKPDRLSPVYLLGNTPDEAFTAYNEAWSGAGICLHRCTGEVCISRYNPDTFEIERGSLPCLAPACQCKPTGRLNLVSPAFNTAVGVMGYFQLTTHSVADIASISAVLNMIELRGMDIFGLPFVLGRKPKQMNVVSKDKTGKATGRVKTTKSLVYLYADDSIQQGLFTSPGQVLQAFIQTPLDPQETRKKLGAGKDRRLGIKEEPKALPAPVEEAPPQIETIDWSKVEAYAASIKVSPGQIVEALDNASDRIIESYADYQGTYTHVYAAMLAMKCGYDPETIKRSLGNINPVIVDTAVQIAYAVLGQPE